MERSVVAVKYLGNSGKLCQMETYAIGFPKQEDAELFCEKHWPTRSGSIMSLKNTLMSDNELYIKQVKKELTTGSIASIVIAKDDFVLVTNETMMNFLPFVQVITQDRTAWMLLFSNLFREFESEDNGRR